MLTQAEVAEIKKKTQKSLLIQNLPPGLRSVMQDMMKLVVTCEVLMAAGAADEDDEAVESFEDAFGNYGADDVAGDAMPD